jgi:hypothetical protein
MGVLDDAIREHLELKRKHGAAEDDLQRQEEEALGPARRDVAQQHEDEADSAVAVQDADLFDGEDGPASPVEADAEPPLEPEPVLGAESEPERVIEPVAEAEPDPAAPAPAEAEQLAAHDEPTALHEPVAQEPTAVEPPPVEPPPAEPAPAGEPDVPALAEEPPVAGQPPVGQEPDIASHPPAEPESDVEPEQPDDQHTTDADDARLGDTQPHGFDAIEDDEEEPEEEDDDVLLSDPEGDEQDVLEDTPDFLQETPEHDRLWFEQKPPRDFDFD